MKLKAVFGSVLYMCVGQYLPTSYSVIKVGQKQFRSFCAHLMLSKCGDNVNIERKASFSRKTEIGDNSGIGANSSIGECIIGNDVMMGPNCTIYHRNHKFNDLSTPMWKQGFQKSNPVVIGNDVWIGGGVTILPGVRIGDHSIIGAAAVVTKDVPEWAIVAGNPAVVKKYRNKSESISSNI